MTPVEILKGADALLAGPQNWTQGAIARRADGSDCNVTDDDATSFCSYGAIVRIARRGVRFEEFDAAREAARAAGSYVAQIIGTRKIADWNDGHGCDFAEVKDVLAQAIALAEKLS